jgi:hypothetical protein
MWVNIALIGIGAQLMSAWLTGVVRRLALSHGMLEVPNERSSYIKITPRGGGLSIVVAVTVGLGAVAVARTLRLGLLMTLIGGVPESLRLGSWMTEAGFLPGFELSSIYALQSGQLSGSAVYLQFEGLCERSNLGYRCHLVRSTIAEV